MSLSKPALVREKLVVRPNIARRIMQTTRCVLLTLVMSPARIYRDVARTADLEFRSDKKNRHAQTGRIAHRYIDCDKLYAFSEPQTVRKPQDTRAAATKLTMARKLKLSNSRSRTSDFLEPWFGRRRGQVENMHDVCQLDASEKRNENCKVVFCGVLYCACGYASLSEPIEIPGTGMQVLQNSQKFRVRVWKSYRPHRSSGYGYGSLTELTEFPGRYTNVVPVLVPAPGYF